MAENHRKISVPTEIEPEVAILVEQLKLASANNETFQPDDIEFIKPKSRQFGGPEVAHAIVYVAVPVLGWVTKAWFDKYVLPVIMQRLKKPSEEFSRWLRRNFPGK